MIASHEAGSSQGPIAVRDLYCASGPCHSAYVVPLDPPTVPVGGAAEALFSDQTDTGF